MKLTILGGFLGSGKTTWLRHQLHRGVFREAFVVVNEAAELPVDDALLQGSTRLSVLAGGCACCDRRAELLTLLRGIADARTRSGQAAWKVEEIVLETSGLADPAPIVAAIRADPVLVYHVVVAEVVVAVDAIYGLAQLKSEPLGRRQVEIADRLIVTKTDEAEEAQLRRLLATLRVLNPGAEISGAIKGSRVPLPDYDGALAQTLPVAEGPASAPIFATRLNIDETIDWTAFSVWLSALLHARGDDVLRVKGVVRTPAGRLLLQSVRRTMQQPEILPDTEPSPDDNGIVIIGRGYEPGDLSRSLRYFAGID